MTRASPTTAYQTPTRGVSKAAHEGPLLRLRSGVADESSDRVDSVALPPRMVVGNGFGNAQRTPIESQVLDLRADS